MTNPTPKPADQSPFDGSDGNAEANIQHQGAPVSGSPNQAPAPTNQDMQQGFPAQQAATLQGQNAKSKTAALLLCFFLGGFGVHNFYLGKTGRGIGQLILLLATIPLIFVGVGVVTAIALSIWVTVEFIMIILGSNGYETEVS